MSFNDLLKQYKVSPDEPKPAQPVKPQPAPVQPVRPQPTPVQPVKPQSAPVQPVRPQPTPVQPVRPQSTPVQPVRPQPTPVQPAQPVKPKPTRPSGAQQLLDDLEKDAHGGTPSLEPVQPLRPGKSKRPSARAPRPAPRQMGRDLPPYWYIDAILLGVTLLGALALLIHWDSVMDAAAELIMTLADVAIVAVIVLGAALFLILWLRRRYRWRRWWRW